MSSLKKRFIEGPLRRFLTKSMKDLLSFNTHEYIEMFKERNNPCQFSKLYPYVLLLLYTITTTDGLHGQIE